MAVHLLCATYHGLMDIKGCTLCSASLLMMRFVNAPQFMVQGFCCAGRPLGSFSQADTGWQPIQETIRKSEKDTRQYQAIRLDNDMVVLLVSDPQAVKSLSALVVPVGSLQDPADHQGLAHFLEHMTLMGSQKYPQPDSLAEFLKLHGGSHNASTAPYRTAFYLEVENDALDGAVDRLADAIAAPLLDKNMPTANVTRSTPS